jgi:hypothetical protein
MKLLSYIFIILMASNQAAFAQSTSTQISPEQLGQLEQKTQTITSVSHYLGSQILASVSELPGQSFVLNAPMNVQRAVYSKAAGESVKAGEPFLTLIGPEVHHYHSQYQISKQLSEQSRALYENNKRLFAAKSLNEATWLEISQQHYQIQLAFDEYAHFFEYAGNFDEQSEALTINAPLGGILTYQQTESIQIEDNLARFIPRDAIRLKINVPVSHIQLIESVTVGSCVLPINIIEKQAQQFYQSVWSSPLTEDCELNIGEQVRVSPRYKVQAFSLSKDSVFEWQGGHHVFSYDGDTYEVNEVSIISSTKDSYIVTSEQLTAGQRVLTSSVSAAQGVLMGLGE